VSGPDAPGTELSGLVRDWTFSPSTPPLVVRLARAKSLLTGLRRAPQSSVIRAVTPRERWTAYFLYAPDGQLTPAHRYTLARLRALQRGLLVVCAVPSPAAIPAQVLDLADAVLWKSLDGYDFSAYGLALREVAAGASGADLLLMNDSVLGPFNDLTPVLDRPTWTLTGFTAWSAFENHVQSYAWHLRGVTPQTVRALRTVLPAHAAFHHFQQVVNCQETRLARVAAGVMSVGAFWYAPTQDLGDPSLRYAVPLIGAGFPFLKRSLAGGKLAGRADQQTVRRLLEDRGHPPG
jgi:hypothetical protein